ncbi:hypothetical protein [Streptomyces longispororuber]|uniref:hypothetical protein n=1 Tax=Streptomyces longispororuber TaxID=68230 RepID=UPI002108BE0A|nr:hypothetical protein [Streptomyces longispororuber]MCQ4209676.1 hypothetical protein [Streptomyces longispororuber]
MSDDPIHAELDQRATAVEQQVVAWRHHLHRNPELSHREVATAGLIAGGRGMAPTTTRAST